ncbi:MAG: hypothetical protein RLZZ416_581 [Candidatus Parcubacteria bacterium]|jgi:hypothetical protein
MQNFAAFLAVILILTPLLLGAALFGARAWWWMAFAIILTLCPFLCAYAIRRSGVRGVTSSQLAPSGAITGGTMTETPLQRFRGSLVAIFATLTTAIVATYFTYTFWMGQVLSYDWSIQGKVVPPESYPMVLLSVWSLLQRAKAHWRPREGAYGKFWSGEDLVEAFAMAIFTGVTLVWALATQTNLSFIVVMLAFLVTAIGDAVLNGRHRYENDLSQSGNQASGTSGGSATSTTTAHNVELDVRIQPRVMPTVYERGTT